MTHLLPHALSPVTGRAQVPGSKSETNRALVLAALADGPSTIVGALKSRDSDLMVEALRALGVEVSTEGSDTLHVSPPTAFHAAEHSIDCGLAGTVMRFVPPLAALADGATAFHGDPHASERPMAGILEGLRRLGADVDADRLPFTVTGPLGRGGEVTVDSTATSQFVSGLLLIGSRLSDGLTLRHDGEGLPSRPHIAMTVEMLRGRGVEVTEVDEVTWRVAPGPIAAVDTRVEPDLTNASVFLAAAAATGGTVTIPGWPAESLQPGMIFLDVAEEMGATITRDGDSVTLTGPDKLRAVDVDLHAGSELTLVVASLMALAEGESRIRGVAHIRGHETDRLAALVNEFTQLGIKASETEDGIVITGGGGTYRQPFETYADHRLVHAAAILGLRIPGITVTDLECVGKTMPDFERDWSTLVNG
ncbi:3-phosphoshikimate 1-carboxyvinyltransferase [Tessaracoccus rhinocerotis]|uniref:3-phosphoshikimate 1-carboxyvinyltransferase n=1 Tax=Tessaracoccus rhinocerotis TaxID=1689449 RepID=A0A553JYG0_9ACTN|nr:3-phosphoshikimate 1-carboxyvinyltransferase [Tessaracoccus rhinocerotis]TRY17474.1 3-phosphoshikimate 1-carboxyvinyltransferase [Tessaracoccus rhinocerotis]